jgi:outer membrane protein OmpA-like peptidoglycan-associated protein
MKKLFFFLIAATGALSAMAQAQPQPQPGGPAMPSKNTYTQDNLLSRWVLDVNGLGGMVTQDITTIGTIGNYNNAVSNSSTGGNLKFTDGSSIGFDAQLGFFFGHQRHFGIGAGFMYMWQTGNVKMNEPFSVSFQSTDYQNNTFRQVITSNQTIKEWVKTTNMNIPIVLKYKNRFSKVLGFTADAGILINLRERNAYNSNATFDYEAIYSYAVSSDGVHTVYDNSVPPASSDVLYTRAAFVPSSKYPTVQDYFNKLRSTGYNVGLGVAPGSNSGTVSYTTGSIGFIAQPSLNFFLSDAVALNLGVYYMYQPFKNATDANYQISNKVLGNGGEYHSVLNTASEIKTQSYGINVGVRLFLGKKRVPPAITFVEQGNPTVCGVCDGSITLHGLPAGKPLSVDYSVNGMAKSPYTGTVDEGGNVKITGLCAGNYTGIVANVDKGKATTGAVTLADPVMKISYQNSTNPTANGACDGSITLFGLFGGRQATINYNLNGSPATYKGMVNPNGSITLTGLCAGNYNGISATVNTCSATANDITLTAPPPPPPPPAPVVEEIKVSTPIKFELNKTVIHESSYPVLEEAVKRLKEDKENYIIVDGYTDITGKPAYNKVLSLKRAKAVKAKLVKMGINPRRIKVVGHGAKSPAATNDTPEGRMMNRRAVMRLNTGG